MQVFRHCCCIGLVEKSLSNATFIIGKYHVHSLNCAIVPLLGYTKYGNGNKRRKISRFSRCALRPVLGAFLRDIGGKILGILHCLAMGTTLGV